MIITWGGDIITVRIIGSNSSNGMKLLKMVRRAVDDTNKNIKIEEVNDNNKNVILPSRNMKNILLIS